MTRRGFAGSTFAAAALAQTAPSSRIAVGQIGCGARGHELMQAVLQQPGVEIVAVADAYKGRVERAIDRTKGRAKAVADYRAILDDKSIDAVVIATPDHWHKRMLLEAVAAGKDIYCEKPMTYRAAEGREIIDAAQKAGRIVQIGSQGVSGSVQQRARDIIASGRLGKVTMIRAAYNRNTASGAWIYPIPPDASASTVNWEQFLGPAPKRPFSLERFFRWRCYKDYSGGISTDLFVHLCTTIHYLMGAKVPARVASMGQLYRWKDREVPDTINAILEYPEGFTVNLSSSFNNQADGESGFYFLGTEASLALNWESLTIVPERAQEDNRWIVESWPKAMEDAYYRDPKVIETEVKRKVVAKPETFKGEGPEATVAHFANFFNGVRTRKGFWEDALAGHRAAACAHMINLSASSRRMVEWDFAKDDIKA